MTDRRTDHVTITSIAIADIPDAFSDAPIKRTDGFLRWSEMPSKLSTDNSRQCMARVDVPPVDT